MDGLDAAVETVDTGAELDLGGAETTSTEVDTPSTEVDPGAAEETSEQTTTETEEAEGQQQATEPDPELQGLDPKYHKDKTVKGMFHALRALRGVYPGGVNEAIKLKSTFDQIGGTEGITELQASGQQLAQLDKDFAEGNPNVLENWTKQAPEGFAKLMPSALDKFQSLDPDGYNHSLGKVFWNTLSQSGTLNQLSNLENALTRGDVESAKAELAKVSSFLHEIHGFASNVPQKKGPTPEQQRFEQERTAFQRERQAEFEKSVTSEARTYAVGKIEAQLAKEFTARKLDLAKLKQSDPDSFNVLMANCYNAVNQAVAADKAALQRFQQAMTAGKKDDALRITRARVDAVFADTVAKTIKAFYSIAGNPKPAAAAAQTAQPGATTNKPANGIMPLSRMPEPSEVDRLRMYTEFGKDKADSMIFNGKVYLKGKRGLYQTP